MPEPLKNLYSHDLIRQLAGHLQRVHPEFDDGAFIAEAGAGLETLELKERAAQIRDALETNLPRDFRAMVEVLLAALHPDDDVPLSDVGMDDRGVRGWAVMPISELVGRRCTEDFDLALDAQRELTKRFSSEFGIRYSILADPERAMATIRRWADDSNYHVRRLASEGTRPRLPWAMQLPMFIADPSPALPILEALKDDPEEYVRRSVANHLNDIAKDHPDLVAKIAARWMDKAGKDRQRLVRHACRTLIKQGHAATLEALGIGPPQLETGPLRVLTPSVNFGDALEFECTLRSTAKTRQRLVIDYAVHFLKANGDQAAKVFKLKTVTLVPGERLTVRKRHAIKPITTRRYYPGQQAVALQINGQKNAAEPFELLMPELAG